MGDRLYLQFIDERIKDGELMKALVHVGVEGILAEFESWLKARILE